MEAGRRSMEEKESEYASLAVRLSEEQTGQSVLVQLATKARVAGSLESTSSLIVLLGDGWFAQVSAQQAAAIVQRRLAHIRTQLSLLQRRQVQLSASIGPVEIREHVTPEDVPSLKEKKGKPRLAHTPKWKPRTGEAEEDEVDRESRRAPRGVKPAEFEALLRRLDELHSEGEDDDEEDDTTEEEDDAEDSSITQSRKVCLLMERR